MARDNWEWGWLNFISLSDLKEPKKRFLDNDIMIVEWVLMLSLPWKSFCRKRNRYRRGSSCSFRWWELWRIFCYSKMSKGYMHTAFWILHIWINVELFCYCKRQKDSQIMNIWILETYFEFTFNFPLDIFLKNIYGTTSISLVAKIFNIICSILKTGKRRRKNNFRLE